MEKTYIFDSHKKTHHNPPINIFGTVKLQWIDAALNKNVNTVHKIEIELSRLTCVFFKRYTYNLVVFT